MRSTGLLVAALALTSATSAWAQTGGTGTFGNRSVGSSFTPSASSAFSRGAGVGSGTGTGGFGNISGIGMGTGMGGTVAGATTRADATAGQLTGSERFVRGARQPGQFVGSDSGDVAANLFSALGRGFAGGMNTRPNNGGNNNTETSSASKVRRSIRIGFTHAPPAGQETAQRVQEIIGRRLPTTRGPVNIEIVERTAILRGVVASDHDRVLAERLIALEAGISAVQNELVVAPPESASPPVALPPATESSPAGPSLPLPAP